MFKYWWIPLVVIMYAVQAFLSKRTNEEKGSYFWFYMLFFFSLIPLWSVVAKFSKNLILDGLIFDLLMSVSFFFMLILLGSGDKFTWIQWVGLIFAISGCILIKVG